MRQYFGDTVKAAAEFSYVSLGLGMVLWRQVTAIWQLYLTFGVMVGFAVGAFYAPLSATATRFRSRATIWPRRKSDIAHQPS